MLREVHQYRLFPGKWTLVIPALVLFGAFAQAANAAKVYLDTVVGFQGKFKPGHWTPLHITVENKGTAIQGMLQIDVSGGSLYKKNQDTVSYIKPLALPRNSRKRYSFSFMPSG